MSIEPIRQDAMERWRLTVYYSGRVQGVGFRYCVRVLSAGFEVVGTVRNLVDGRVEMVAEGQREELDAFCVAIRESDVGSFVRGEQASWAAASGGLRGFEILK